MFPARVRKRAIDAAVAFVTTRLNGEDGLGAIFPAMANTVMMFDALGYPDDHPDVVIARRSIEKLLVVKPDEAYCQPCVSPVWDTALVCSRTAGGRRRRGHQTGRARASNGSSHSRSCDIAGDWSVQRPNVRPGGWAFQYANAYYPDLDDTAVVVMAMDRVQHMLGSRSIRPAIERAREWISGLQSRNGGWAAFDADNAYYYLNNIPFSDHGALLDPPTEDLTGRCMSMLAQLGEQARTTPRSYRDSNSSGAPSIPKAAGMAAGA